MIQVLRAGDRVASPWKNGGGTTTEVIKSPSDADLNNFDWRVSIAQIASSGPFSAFRGIDRHLALLEGCLSLKIAGRDAIELTAGSSPIGFPGDAATEAELIGDKAVDLNVMVRRDAFTAQVTRRVLAGAVQSVAAVTLIFPLADVVVSVDAANIGLAYQDAIFMRGATKLTIESEVECYWIEIFSRSDQSTAIRHGTGAF